MIYWVDTEEQKIYRRKRDHTGKETVISSGLGYVVAIAVDPISGRLQNLSRLNHSILRNRKLMYSKVPPFFRWYSNIL